MRIRRVLIVDDSAVARRCLADIFTAESGFEVCGIAGDGANALERFERLQPDLVTLDLEMPKLDGIEFLRTIRLREPRRPVLVVSSQTHHGAARTVEALAAGASDYIEKPSTRLDGCSREAFAEQLLMKARTLVIRDPFVTARRPEFRPRGTAPAQARAPYRAVLIGSSTGGPEALAKVLPHLCDLPLPVLIVQHMPPHFTHLLADRLANICSSRVQEAEDHAILQGGDIVIAPGDRHLRLQHHGSESNDLHVEIGSDPAVRFCRPSVDVLFESAAAQLGERTLAVILTGMGSDGTAGAMQLKRAGATVYAQDQQSSVVWGMPGSVVRAGAADRVLPLSAIGPAINRAILQASSMTRFQERPKRDGDDVTHIR